MNEPAHDAEEELAQRAALDFLTLHLADRAADRVLPLQHYLQRFPRFEQRIAAEWLRLHGAPVAANTTAAPSTEPDADPRIPTGYRLLRELGRGGQGTVYLARDERLGRNVALKILERGLAAFAGPSSLRFQREVAAISKLDHPCLCTIHDAGETGTTSWIAMKFVDGPSLQQQIATARATGGPPARRESIDAAARCIERLAEGLHQAHVAGIVHRDIKPGNVLLAPDGTPVLVDFGLARQEVAAAAVAAAVTLPGTVAGTPSYLAPELLRDLPADAQSDVWSLGACLFELLTLERPFAGPTIEAEVRARITHPVRDVRRVNPAVPRDLAVIVATALATEPARRYRSAADLAADLRRYRERQPIQARPASVLLVLRRWTQRNPALSTSLGALLVVLAAALGITLSLLRDTRAALADVTRLSDLKLAADLQVRAAALWPLRQERISGPDGFDAWLAAADAVLQRRSLHERALERARAAGDPAAWQREQLESLLVRFDELQSRRTRVAANREFARTVEQRSLVDQQEAWRTTAAAIAASRQYGGLQLRPQHGLVPLGPDPASGMFEFAHLQSGTVPVRDPATGKLLLTADSCIVLVLLPGGRVALGSEAVVPADGHPANVDAAAVAGNGPCYTVRLDPFFVGKHETTQAQWRRHTGRNPSNYNTESEMRGPPITELNPVEQVDWPTTDRVLRELGLCVPTEAQWEYAYRAGTATPFPFGDSDRDLQNRENLADADAERLSESGNNWPFQQWLHDGNAVHARIGSFLPNGFGLHDMGGNVKEWCADSWENYADVPPRDGDGLRFGRFDKYRVVRGGGFASDPVHARSGHRTGYPVTVGPGEIGVRAARAVDK